MIFIILFQYFLIYQGPQENGDTQASFNHSKALLMCLGILCFSARVM